MKNLNGTLFFLQLMICLVTLQAHSQLTEQDVNRRFPTYARKETAATIFTKAKSGELELLVSGKSGGDIGGGKVLICQETSGKQGLTFSIEALDLFEGRSTGLNPNFGDAVTISQKLEFVLNRLARVAPTRAYVYREWIQDFFKNPGEVQSDEGFYVPNADDLDVSKVPKRCQFVQVTGQREPMLNLNIYGSPRYVINFSAFNLLDDDSKIALIFHEIIYREARLYGIRTSNSVRALTALLLSNRMDTITTQEFNSRISLAKFQCREQSGVLQKCMGIDPKTKNEVEHFEHQSKVTPANSFEFQQPNINIFLNGKFLKKATKGNQVFDLDFYGPVEINSLINANKTFKLNDSVQLIPSEKAAFNIVGTFRSGFAFFSAITMDNRDGIRRTQPSVRIVRGNQIFVGEKCDFNGGTTNLATFEDGAFHREAISKGVLSADISPSHNIFEIVCSGFTKYIRGRVLKSSISEDSETFENSFSLVFVDENSPIIRPYDRTKKMGPYNLMRLFQDN